jgi:glycosyltransferase involved in cell wall biosynthesis
VFHSPSIARFDLVPDAALTQSARGGGTIWHAGRHVVRFIADCELEPGWYRMQLGVRTPDRIAVRKRAELFADFGTGPTKLDEFEWNRELNEDLSFRLPSRATQFQLTLRHCTGEFTLSRFEVGRTSRARTISRALKLKWKLLRSYNCLWPVVSRGGKLLASGRLHEFGQKLLRGIPDSRTMRIEVKRAEEVAAMWWRRRAISSEQLTALKTVADEIANPEPIAVLLPVDPMRIDHACQSILSVFRQVYPHWELFVVSTNRETTEKLSAMLAWDCRAIHIAPPAGEGLVWTTTTALSQTRSNRIVVLPPNWELSEDALLRFAQTDAESVISEAPSSELSRFVPAILPCSTLTKNLPNWSNPTVTGLVQWSSQAIPLDAYRLPEQLLMPLDGSRSITTRLRNSTSTSPLVLAGDIRGISGWDHVNFAILKGLSSAGVPLQHHTASYVLPELLPPQLQFEKTHRTTTQPQLAMSPPFLLSRFSIDSQTAVFTMWESDRLDAKEVEVLNRSRVVIVPSQWGADCFRDSGVRVPIEVVPLGYDPLIFSPIGQRPQLCTFGTAGALSAGGLRKNVRRVIELFQTAFPHEADVRLRVKITPDCPPLEIEHDSRVELLRASLPYPELAAWNHSLTAYVNASFAEGFGFHLLEAMACGVPLISPHYSGLTEFFDSQTGYCVPHRIVEAKNAIYSGSWADPDDDAIRDAMRRVYHNRAESDQFAAQAAARARRFTWRDTGRKLLQVLKRHGLLEASR